MKASSFIDLAEKSRKELLERWKVEPLFAILQMDSKIHKNPMTVYCFIHPKDKNRTTLKSLRYTHREL